MKTTLHYVGETACIHNYFRKFRCNPPVRLVVLFLVIAWAGKFRAQHMATEEWSLYQEVSGVEIYAKVEDCPRNAGYDRRNVILKFHNTEEHNCSISYHMDLYYSGKCQTCDDVDEEYSVTISMAPAEILQGDCDMSQTGLTLFAGWSEKGVKDVHFSGFELTDLTVLIEEKPEQSNQSKFYSLDLRDLRSTIMSMRDKIASAKKGSGTQDEIEENKRYQNATSQLISAIEILIIRDAVAVEKDDLKEPFIITESEATYLSAKSIAYINGHPNRMSITNLK